VPVVKQIAEASLSGKHQHQKSNREFLHYCIFTLTLNDCALSHVDTRINVVLSRFRIEKASVQTSNSKYD
jgi:hypothetical protein